MFSVSNNNERRSMSPQGCYTEEPRLSQHAHTLHTNTHGHACRIPPAHPNRLRESERVAKVWPWRRCGSRMCSAREKVSPSRKAREKVLTPLGWLAAARDRPPRDRWPLPPCGASARRARPGTPDFEKLRLWRRTDGRTNSF